MHTAGRLDRTDVFFSSCKHSPLESLLWAETGFELTLLNCSATFRLLNTEALLTIRCSEAVLTVDETDLFDAQLFCVFLSEKLEQYEMCKG